jgi:hypothetical protein
MTNELKDLVDRFGIFAVLDDLSGVCGHKAEQPGRYAADWAATESAIDAVASKVLDLFQEPIT